MFFILSLLEFENYIEFFFLVIYGEDDYKCLLEDFLVFYCDCLKECFEVVLLILGIKEL